MKRLDVSQRTVSNTRDHLSQDDIRKVIKPVLTDCLRFIGFKPLLCEILQPCLAVDDTTIDFIVFRLQFLHEFRQGMGTNVDGNAVIDFLLAELKAGRGVSCTLFLLGCHYVSSP